MLLQTSNGIWRSNRSRGVCSSAVLHRMCEQPTRSEESARAACRTRDSSSFLWHCQNPALSANNASDKERDRQIKEIFRISKPRFTHKFVHFFWGCRFRNLLWWQWHQFSRRCYTGAIERTRRHPLLFISNGSPRFNELRVYKWNRSISEYGG